MKVFLKTFLAVAAAVSVISASAPAVAQGGGGGWMTQGAEVLPMGKHAFEARVGFPSSTFGVHIPVMPVLEVTPFLSMDYLGYGVRGWIAAGFGDTFGVQLKGQIWKQGPHSISIGADLGIALTYIGFFNAAFQIGGPEIKYSHRWNNPRIAVIAGFRMPIRVWMRGAAFADIPMLFNAGFEYNVIPNLNIHAKLEFGPYLLATAAGAAADGAVGFQFGISYLW